MKLNFGIPTKSAVIAAENIVEKNKIATFSLLYIYIVI